MYSRRSCIVLTGLCTEENENLNKLKEDVVETLCKTGISKEEITTSTNSTELEKPTKIIRKTGS